MLEGPVCIGRSMGAQFFKGDAIPARTCVGVAALPLPGAVFEVECVAEVAKP